MARRKKTKLELEAHHTAELAKHMQVLGREGGLGRSLVHAISMSGVYSSETVGRVRQALNLP